MMPAVGAVEEEPEIVALHEVGAEAEGEVGDSDCIMRVFNCESCASSRTFLFLVC